MLGARGELDLGHEHLGAGLSLVIVGDSTGDSSVEFFVFGSHLLGGLVVGAFEGGVGFVLEEGEHALLVLLADAFGAGDGTMHREVEWGIAVFIAGVCRDSHDLEEPSENVEVTLLGGSVEGRDPAWEKGVVG